MTKRTIPIRRPSAHFTFDVDLQGKRIRIRLDWLTRFEYYTTALSDLETDKVIVAGVGLHPDVDLLQNTDTDVGKLYLTGTPPTPDNLGSANSLIWEFED